MKANFISFSHEELLEMEELNIGDEIDCPRCKKTHIVRGGLDKKGEETNSLMFVNCNKNTTLLVGTAGRRTLYK